MAGDETIIKFNDVHFEHGFKHPILAGANFSVRSGMKMALSTRVSGGMSPQLCHGPS
jgi:ABC-type transport system involved in Fe-S cluster assembly fused permease/ATPase subunit